MHIFQVQQKMDIWCTSITAANAYHRRPASSTWPWPHIKSWALLSSHIICYQVTLQSWICIDSSLRMCMESLWVPSNAHADADRVVNDNPASIRMGIRWNPHWLHMLIKDGILSLVRVLSSPVLC